MAVRSFEDFNAYVTVGSGTGGLASLPSGAWTMIMLVKPAVGEGSRSYINLNDGFVRVLGIWNDSTDGQFLVSDGISVTIKFGLAPTNGSWAVIAVTKASGTATPRGHVFNGTSWSHANGTGTLGNIATTIDNVSFMNAPSTPDVPADWWREGRAAAFAVYTTALSDGELEAMEDTAQSWLDEAPVGMWRLNQAATSTAVTDDTANSWDQTATDSTSVVTDDDPPFFAFGLSGEEQGATVTPAAVAAVAAVPAATLTWTSTQTPAAVAAVAAIPGPTVSGTGAVSVSAVAATTAVPAVTVQAGTVYYRSVIDALVVIPAPTISAGNILILTPAAVAATTAVPAATVQAGGTTVGPAAIAATVTIPEVIRQTSGGHDGHVRTYGYRVGYLPV